MGVKSINRISSEDLDFIKLVALLDADLKIRDGEEHSFYSQFNKIDKLKNVVVCYLDGIAAGCGAFKEYDSQTVEIKRMYVLPEFRRKGIAIEVLSELETWAKDIGYSWCILETGKKQPEAIALYQMAGYSIIPNYGQYTGKDNSVCMKKSIV